MVVNNYDKTMVCEGFIYFKLASKMLLYLNLDLNKDDGLTILQLPNVFVLDRFSKSLTINIREFSLEYMIFSIEYLGLEYIYQYKKLFLSITLCLDRSSYMTSIGSSCFSFFYSDRIVAVM